MSKRKPATNPPATSAAPSAGAAQGRSGADRADVLAEATATARAMQQELNSTVKASTVQVGALRELLAQAAQADGRITALIEAGITALIDTRIAEAAAGIGERLNAEVTRLMDELGKKLDHVQGETAQKIFTEFDELGALLMAVDRPGTPPLAQVVAEVAAHPGQGLVQPVESSTDLDDRAVSGALAQVAETLAATAGVRVTATLDDREITADADTDPGGKTRFRVAVTAETATTQISGAELDAVAACSAVLPRLGSTGFQIEVEDDGSWTASATCRGHRFRANAYGAGLAADKLAAGLLHNSRCRCGRLAAALPDDRPSDADLRMADGSWIPAAKASVMGVCRWTRKGSRWVPGCPDQARQGDA